ncbi:MAG: transposase [candidate division KSB1 bacterium]|nr:transposase [candidate division KSB1 bacterium]
MFTWAKFRRRQGAVKLHNLLAKLLPQYALVADGKTHNCHPARDRHFEPCDLLIFDRVYLDYAWLYRLHQIGSKVTPLMRLSSSCRLPILRYCAGCTIGPRRPARNMSLLAHRLDLSALHVAELYRRRRQIKLFSQWIKQALEIKAFYGISKNAVLIQVWTAVIAYLLLVRKPLPSQK